MDVKDSTFFPYAIPYCYVQLKPGTELTIVRLHCTLPGLTGGTFLHWVGCLTKHLGITICSEVKQGGPMGQFIVQKCCWKIRSFRL